MRSVPSRAVLLALAFLSLASPMLAAGVRVHRAEEPGVLAEVWQAVRQLVPILMKGRAGQDPNGSPEPVTAGTTGEPDTEGRAGQDPNG